MASISENTTLGQLDPNMSLGELVDEMRSNGMLKNDRLYRDTDNWLNKIKRSFKEMDSAIMEMAEPWAKVDEAASKYAKTVGATKKGLEELRRASIRNVHVGNIGFDFNMSAEELIEAQQNYVKGIGRNVKLGLDDSRTLAAITSVYGDSSEMFASFDKFGVSMEGVGTHMGKMFNEASKNGIVLEKYVNNIKQGLEMANRYTFRDGLKGMEAMAKRAAAIKMDMQQVQSFAGAFDTVENSLQNAAKLQVLGGQFASGADALGLLNDSLNDLDGLQKRMENFTNGMGTLNKQTGEVEISTFNRLRLQQYAKVTGQDEGKVMEVARRQAMRGEIESQLRSSGNFAALDEDFKELIKNTATFKNGRAGVTINGEFKDIAELDNKDREALIKETQGQSEDIKDIARDVRSLKDMRSGVKKQYENVQARTTARWVGSTAKGATSWVAGGWLAGFAKNIAMPILAVAGAITTIVGAIKGIGAIWSRGGTSSIGDSAQRILRRGSARGAKGATTTAKVSKGVKGIPRGGKKILSSAGKEYTQVGTKVFNSAGKEIFGGAKSAVTRGAVDAGKASIGRRGAGRLATRAAIKVGGKQGAEILAKLGAGAAKGAGVGIIGAAGNIATDALVSSGKMKEGGGAHMAMKAGSSALEGAAMGMMLGSVIPGVGNAVGAAIGAVAGAAIGVVKVQKVRNEKLVDSQLQKLGIERHGSYGTKRLSDIDKALETGKMSNSLRKRLLREGDADIVNQINAVRDKKKEDKEKRKQDRRDRFDKHLEMFANISKNKFGTAEFEIGTAYFGGRGIRGRGNLVETVFPAAQRIKGSRLDGKSKEFSILETLNLAKKKEERQQAQRKPEEKKNEPINVNINGTIKLEAPNGQSVDIMKEIKKNPQLMNELTQMIIKSMNKQQHGGYVSDRTFGNNPI